MRFFARYYKNYKKYLIITVCAVILSVVAEMLQPTLMSNVVDIGLVNMNFKYIVGCGLLINDLRNFPWSDIISII